MRMSATSDTNLNSDPAHDPIVFGLAYMYDNFGHFATWDSVVLRVDFIRYDIDASGDNSHHTAYVRLTQTWGGHRVQMPLRVARMMMPQRLLDFYEQKITDLLQDDGDESITQTQLLEGYEEGLSGNNQ
ncbi:hypothetical protein PM082_019375 [Marasmius tenuissimus]|nr:hypothetical protein PM082_019267 [Marasmius tenuissimus]KAJ8075048.1 hypothetical protein PM082_019375 [Marasmius tenuissimus]